VSGDEGEPQESEAIKTIKADMDKKLVKEQNKNKQLSEAFAQEKERNAKNKAEQDKKLKELTELVAALAANKEAPPLADREKLNDLRKDKDRKIKEKPKSKTNNRSEKEDHQEEEDGHEELSEPSGEEEEESSEEEKILRLLQNAKIKNHQGIINININHKKREREFRPQQEKCRAKDKSGKKCGYKNPIGTSKCLQCRKTL
jgi:hypothetical protein